MKFRIDGVTTYAMSAHLPYLNRQDSQDVWQDQIWCMRQILKGSRHHDNLFLMCDLLVHVTSESSDERSALLNLLERDLGLSHTIPPVHTWSNTRGSQTKIDYILYRTPRSETLDTKVVEESDTVLGSDHRMVILTVSLNKIPGRRARQKRTRCGKWLLDYANAAPALNNLATQADLQGKDLTESDVLHVGQPACFRPRRFRFSDTPEIKALIRERKKRQGPIREETIRQRDRASQGRGQDKLAHRAARQSCRWGLSGHQLL